MVKVEKDGIVDAIADHLITKKKQSAMFAWSTEAMKRFP